jgi:tRNA synthetases class I (R)
MIYCNEDDIVHNIDIDDLYKKNLTRSLKHLSIFNKILNRVHKRINKTSQDKKNVQHIWFTIPTFILGEQTYDQGDCIAHIIGKLVDNGFVVKYLHPNTIFVTWGQWIPTYVRDEYFNKTGIVIDEKGIVVKKNEKSNEEQNKIDAVSSQPQSKELKQFTPIGKYKPTGHLLYNADLFDAITINKLNT